MESMRLGNRNQRARNFEEEADSETALMAIDQNDQETQEKPVENEEKEPKKAKRTRKPIIRLKPNHLMDSKRGMKKLFETIKASKVTEMAKKDDIKALSRYISVTKQWGYDMMSKYEPNFLFQRIMEIGQKPPIPGYLMDMRKAYKNEMTWEELERRNMPAEEADLLGLAENIDPNNNQNIGENELEISQRAQGEAQKQPNISISEQSGQNMSKGHLFTSSSVSQQSQPVQSQKFRTHHEILQEQYKQMQEIAGKNPSTVPEIQKEIMKTGQITQNSSERKQESLTEKEHFGPVHESLDWEPRENGEETTEVLSDKKRNERQESNQFSKSENIIGEPRPEFTEDELANAETVISQPEKRVKKNEEH